MSGYLTAKNDAQCEFTEKKSRFITCVRCVETPGQAEQFLKEVREKYADARHVCFAYRTHTPFAEKCGDDGEPQGTAGKPMLAVLQKEEIYDICVAVVRYFGGILLGAGGLARAYTKGCADGVHAAGKATRQAALRLNISLPYSYYQPLLQRLEAFSAVVEQRSFSQNADLRLLLPEAQRERFEAMLRELSAGSAEITHSERLFACF